MKSSVLSLSEMPGSTLDLQGRAQEKDLDPHQRFRKMVSELRGKVDKKGQINEKGCGKLKEKRDEEF